jgi:hypothetical protein
MSPFLGEKMEMPPFLWESYIWATFKEEFLSEMLCIIEIPRSMIQKEGILTENMKYFIFDYSIAFHFHADIHFAFVRGNFSFFSSVFLGLVIIFLLRFTLE